MFFFLPLAPVVPARSGEGIVIETLFSNEKPMDSGLPLRGVHQTKPVRDTNLGTVVLAISVDRY